MYPCAGYLGHLFRTIGDLRHPLDLPSCMAFTKKCSCPTIDNGQASVPGRCRWLPGQTGSKMASSPCPWQENRGANTITCKSRAMVSYDVKSSHLPLVQTTSM